MEYWKNEPGHNVICSIWENELCKDTAEIEILGTETTGYGIIGRLTVLTKEISSMKMSISKSN